MLVQDEVHFKTIDGVIIRGTLYPAANRGPGIIMSPGFSCVKEMMGLPEVAAYFQKAGITALIYDPRTTGLSDGTPRNDIDPPKQVEDYSDALSFLSNLPIVQPDQVIIWGMSFAGTVSLCAGAFDKRARAIIAVCPLTRLECSSEKLPNVVAKCMRDRESQAKGNPPFYIPMLTDRGENPAGFGIGIDREQYAKVVNAGKEIAPNHVNRTTIQTYYKMLMWQPFALLRHLVPTPVMFVVPELDKLSPKETQLGHFQTLPGPKRLHIEPNRGHMDILEGAHLPGLMELQIAFIYDVLQGKLSDGHEA
ncbi:MAG: hypothetical protein Q9181_002807 [Wetmoreana brouardii]